MMFVWRIRVATDPLLNPKILRNAFYSRILLISLFGTFIISGLLFTMPLLLRDIYQSTTMEIVFILFPGALVAGLLSKSLRTKERSVSLSSDYSSSLTLSYVIGSDVWMITVALFIAYIGFPLIQSATADLISHSLGKAENGTGLGLNFSPSSRQAK